jgi:hypothetical protein
VTPCPVHLVEEETKIAVLADELDASPSWLIDLRFRDTGCSPCFCQLTNDSIISARAWISGRLRKEFDGQTILAKPPSDLTCPFCLPAAHTPLILPKRFQRGMLSACRRCRSGAL